MENYANTTFLGGTCNETTWRDELIAMLNKNVEVFNTVVDDWTPECQAREEEAKKHARFVLVVITSAMTGVFFIAEAVYCSNKRPERTLFYVIPDGFDKGQMMSLRAVERMIKNNGGQIFESLEGVASFLNSAYNN